MRQEIYNDHPECRRILPYRLCLENWENTKLGMSNGIYLLFLLIKQSQILQEIQPDSTDYLRTVQRSMSGPNAT